MDNNTFYRKFLSAYGANTPDARAMSLGWETLESQMARFDIVSKEIGEGTLMDAGCGFGDFYFFIEKTHPNTRYSGIDIYPMFTAICRGRGLDVRTMDIFNLTEEYDYILAIGIFNIGTDLWKGVGHLLPLARKKFILNALHSKHKKTDNVITYDPENVQKRFGGKLIKDDRLPIDFFLVVD